MQLLLFFIDFYFTVFGKSEYRKKYAGQLGSILILGDKRVLPRAGFEPMGAK